MANGGGHSPQHLQQILIKIIMMMMIIIIVIMMMMMKMIDRDESCVRFS